MKKLAIYPGTFDPLTNGHLDIIKRGSLIFDKVVIAVASSENKNPSFSLQDRHKMIELMIEDNKQLKNVECITFDCLLASLARDLNASAIIRGIRVMSDFEYELQMGYANASLNDKLDTIYFMPTLPNAFISSSIVRGILAYNGKISHLVPRAILEYLKNLKPELKESN